MTSAVMVTAKPTSNIAAPVNAGWKRRDTVGIFLNGMAVSFLAVSNTCLKSILLELYHLYAALYQK